jgi:hypothetical protein
MLTDTEIEKLKDGRDKANDFIVRRKFKKWLAGLHVVNYAILRYLPQDQTRKLVKLEHIQNLIQLLVNFLGDSAVPITQMNGEDMVIIPNQPDRYAEPEEQMLNGEIKRLVDDLFQFLSNEDVREVIQNELNHYQPDYVLEKRELRKKRHLSPQPSPESGPA